MSLHLESAAPGCHVLHYESLPSWIVGTESLPFAQEELTDISVDPESLLLSVVNVSDSETRCITVTVEDARIKVYKVDASGNVMEEEQELLESGSYRTSEGNVLNCTTLICTIPPLHIVDVGFLTNYTEAIYSDIKELKHSESSSSLETVTLCFFPLEISKTSSYLCTQGFNGTLTHFFPQTKYALDFRCAVGTPVLAVGDGEIVQIRDSSTVSGIHVDNLFDWNSVMLKLVGGEEIYVEYVHIQHNSLQVSIGDKVKANQVLCLSGDAGFCPEPHLHIQVHRSAEDDAPTIPFVFKLGVHGDSRVPIAGEYFP